MKVKLSGHRASASLIIIHTEQASDEGPGHHDLSADLMKGPTQYYKYKRFPSLPLIPITHLKSEGKKRRNLAP